MKKVLTGFLLAIILGTFGYAGYVYATAPKVMKTYRLIFESGQVSEIGAERYSVVPPCVVFYREGKTLAFCNFPVIIDAGSETPSPSPTPTSNGPSSGTSSDNLRADS